MTSTTRLRLFAWILLVLFPTSGSLLSKTVVRVDRDGPIDSPQQARDEMGKLRSEGATGPFEIVLGDGTYQLAEPLTLGPEDGRVTWKASNGANPILSGGREISGWSKRSDGLWTTRLEDDEWNFEQLWINGRRATRAKEPDHFFHYLIGSHEKTEKLKDGGSIAHQTLLTRSEDLTFLSGTPDEERSQIQALFFHKWDNTRKYLDSFEVEKGLLHISGRPMKSHNPLTRNTGFVIENARAALDEPGEWFLSPSGELIYHPREGEKIETARAVAPIIEQLIIVSGNSESGELIEDLSFRGLSFKHSGWWTPDRGFDPSQAASPIEAVVQVDGAKNLKIEDCEVAHTGIYGIWFREGCSHCTITRTHLHDLGAGGIRLGDTRIPSRIEEQSNHHNIENNLLHAGGRVFPCAVGIWVGQSGNNTIRHNVIADFLYSGISLGWRWGYDKSLAKENLVEFNHIHHIGQGWLSDMGAVYTLGPSEGTKIRNNVIHDISSWGYGGWGLYNDEGSTGILMENNLVYRTKSGGYHQHYGRENLIRNNILALGREYQLRRSRVEDHISFTLERNIVYWDKGELFHGSWKDDGVHLRKNLYFREGDQPIDFEGMTFSEWQASGKDEGSLIGNPGFANPANADFRVIDETNVNKIDFRTFDYTRAGLTGDASWIEKGRNVPVPEISDPPPVPQFSLSEDFELGGLNEDFHVSEGGDPEAIAVVTDSDAASGDHVLRMRDMEKQEHRYLPLFSFAPGHDEGTTRCRFRIRLGQDSVFQHEWRNGASPYRVGPTLWIQDSLLRIGNGVRPSLPLPTDEWIEIEVVAPLGEKAGTWDLAVKFLSSGEKQTFSDIPNLNPEWKTLDWLGFVSQATSETVLYFDDIELVQPE